MKKTHSLKEAFALFSQESSRLEKSYSVLAEEFSKIQQRLESAYRIQTAIIENLGSAVICISESGVITLFNEALYDLTHILPQEALLKPYAQVFEDTLFGFSVQESITNKTPSQHLVILLKNNDREHELEVTASYIDKVGLVILARDVTEINRLRKAALTNSRLSEIGEMAATLAHEIRNPLGGIEGFASLLVRDLEASPKLSNMAKNIAEGACHLNGLVTSILIYAKPLEMRLTKTDISSLVEEVIQLIPKTKNIHFEKPLQPLNSIVDIHHLKRALHNIVQNALEAASMEVQITLSATTEEIFIHVKDDGPGILPEHLSKIFSPFFTTKTRGTGLGLSESHKIISALDGHITIDTLINAGSCFTIQLRKSV
jgi:signal transduction histidine kinase